MTCYTGDFKAGIFMMLCGKAFEFILKCIKFSTKLTHFEKKLKCGIKVHQYFFHYRDSKKYV